MERTLAFFGFGEAGQAFASGVGQAGLTLSAYDIKLEDADQAPALRGIMKRLQVQAVSVADLGRDRDVFCLVTADQAGAAARAVAPYLHGGGLWLDGNSCSPGSKRQAAAVIEATGGRYVDLAIMAPVHPHRHRTPMLVSGPHAAAAAEVLATLGMNASVAGPEVGQASAIKMMRSVIIKGFEALTAEAFLAARAAGVEDAVIASLQASDPGLNWSGRASYNLDRMLVHGTRRAAEMAEVAATLRELGLPDRMAQATIPWQAELAALRLDPGPDSLGQRADMILRALR
ncbi:MAG: 3-hydroxyisobutyrate dehydrogenase [Rhodobacteraceae bacterium PARR1]|nr:MAG: 3-hydroxyisobutyrate dehydrogenase [Rhodobacteraceae bacterium PARR1]